MPNGAMPLQRDPVRPSDGYILNPLEAREYNLNSTRGLPQWRPARRPRQSLPAPALSPIDDVPYKRWGALYAGDTLIEAVPRHAIVMNLGKDVGPLLFHCDPEWEVFGTSGGPTIDETKLRAERNYP